MLDIDLGQQLFRVNDVAYITESFICAGLNNGGISGEKKRTVYSNLHASSLQFFYTFIHSNTLLAVFRVEADAASASEEVRAAMVVEGSESSRDTKNRIKKVKALAGGSGYLVVSCCSSGVVSVYDLKGAVNSLMDEDDDSDGGKSSGSDDKFASRRSSPIWRR